MHTFYIAERESTMPKRMPLEKHRVSLAVGVAVVFLFVALPRRSPAEDLA